MKTKTLRAILREELEDVGVRLRVTAYDPTYSILTIHFAPGSKPAALSIPYQRFDNRTEVSVPLRVVPGEQDV